MTVPLRARPRLGRNLLLLAVLASACGDPRGGAVPAFGAPKASLSAFLDSTLTDSNRRVNRDSTRQDSSATASGRRQVAHERPEERSFQGAYRFDPTASEFRPCGSRVSYKIVGRPDAMMRLRDRFRWHAIDPMRPLYAVFHGSIVSDSQAGVPARATDSATLEASGQRFLLVRTDSLRTWRRGDCGMNQPPRW